MLAEFVGPLPLQLQIEEITEPKLRLHSLTLILLVKIEVFAAEELEVELYLQQLE